MRPAILSLFASTLLLAQAPAKAPAPAPEESAPATAAQTYAQAIAGMEMMVVGAAEAMPESAYGYVPAGGEFKDVRTFAQQIRHVALVNFMAGGAISGRKPEADPVQRAKDLKTKAELMAFLKESFAFARQAVEGMKESELYQPVPSLLGKGKTNRLMLALVPVGHGADHYGQMVIYLRHNGIIPPMSRR